MYKVSLIFVTARYYTVTTPKQYYCLINCMSRQIADITIHVLLFATVKPLMENIWQLIRIWKKSIDDVFGVWTGTEKQFHLFV